MGWMRFAHRPHSFKQDELDQALRVAGLQLSLNGNSARPESGVIFFSQVDAPLYQQLRELSANGSRVLAVASSSRLIEGEVSWALLQSGASDVLSSEQPGNAVPEIAARLQR